MPNSIIQGLAPGLGSEQSYSHKEIFWDTEGRAYLPGYVQTNGSAARDVTNTSYIGTLQPGLLMGKRTSDSLYAPSILGATTVAFTASGTELTVSTAVATEITRRIGSTGTLLMSGPPSAAGTVATTAVTYSAVSTSTGVITITAITAASYILGSVIRPNDGSGTVKGVLDQELRVTDDDGNNIAATVAKLAIQGTFVASQLINYPSDASLKEWYKGLLNTPTTGPGPCRFNDNF